ncbi:MAG: hypothetical protein AABW58_01110 [Nanoarchaeota archaeon]
MIEDILEEIFPWFLDSKYKISSIGAILIVLGLVLKIFNYSTNWLIFLGIIIFILGLIIRK